MSFVIQASPLTKVFLQREWTARCIEDPELIHKSEPGLFTVTVPRSMGAIVLEHMRPVAFQDLVPKQKNRKVEHDETRDVVPWLTGGDGGTRFSETDIYGVVEIDMGMNYTQLLSQMLMLEASQAVAGPETGEKAAARAAHMAKQTQMLQAKARNDLKNAVVNAMERANERVLRGAKRTYSYLHKQFQRNIEQGVGRYEPSGTEALCAFILREEITKARAKKRDMMQQVSNVMNDVVNL